MSKDSDLSRYLGGADGVWLLTEAYIRKYEVANEDRRSVNLYIAPFVMKLGDLTGHIWKGGTQAMYLPKITFARKINLADRDLERIKTVKATVFIK